MAGLVGLPPALTHYLAGNRPERAGHGLYAGDHDAVNADILAFIAGRPLPGPPQRG